MSAPATSSAGSPSSAGPQATDPHADTDTLRAELDEPSLEVFGLLDHRTRRRAISPAQALGGHYLAFEDGGETKFVELNSRINHLGRGLSCEVRFDHQRVSRSHAIIVLQGRRARVLDNRSANGTLLNGREILANNLQDGDIVRLGPVAMQYVRVPL